MFKGILIALFAIILDQLSKAYAYNWLSTNGSFNEVTSFFNLVTAWNTGVSFSMLNNLGQNGVYLLSGFAVLVVLLLIYWLSREKSSYMQIALGCVIGGALGNVLDRIRLNAVFDFLDFHINTHHWPAFNLADTFICIGAMMIIFEEMFFQKTKDLKATTSTPTDITIDETMEEHSDRKENQ